MRGYKLPANSSRYFESYQEAISQVPGNMLVDIHPRTGHLYNSMHRHQSIFYDSLYSTVNPFHFSQSTSEFTKILPTLSGSIFVEIGCGQGEFVDWLKSMGEIAYGFDPVCRKLAPYLISEIFNDEKVKNFLSSTSRTVFIMRCVLPHIEEPFQFIKKTMTKFPNAKFLMQHQRIEYYDSTSSWNALMHDHVNIFQLQDFANYFNIDFSSIFCDGEWEQIMIGPKIEKQILINANGMDLIERLLLARKRHLQILANQEPVHFFGAAGKGINFAHACVEAGVNLQGAIDDSSLFAGKYLEGSGVRVSSPGDLTPAKTKNAALIVMNHSHLASARERFRNFASVDSLHTLCETNN